MLLLSFSGLLYWSNDPLILFCWLYRWSFKAAVKCAIKSSRQLTGLIYKQMQPVINKRLKWSNGWESFYMKSSNLLSLSPQPSESLMLQDPGLRIRKRQTLNLCVKNNPLSKASVHTSWRPCWGGGPGRCAGSPCGAAFLELLQIPRDPKEPTQLPSSRLLQARPREF